MLLNKHPLLLRRAELSVAVNGLWVNLGQLARVLSRHCEPALYCTGDEKWELVLRGSATLVKVGQNYFAITTIHQFNTFDVGHFVLKGDRDGYYHTSNRCSFPIGDHGYGNDLYLFDFTHAVESGSISAQKFFHLDANSVISKGDDIVAGQLYGYAICDQFIKTEDTRFSCNLKSIGLVNRQMNFDYLGDFFLSTAMTTWKQLGAGPTDPDGLSGAPIFAIVSSPAGLVAKYAGMAALAGHETITAIKGDRVYRLVVQRQLSNAVRS